MNFAENDNVKIELLDGIIFFSYKEKNINIEVAKKTVQDRLQISKGINRPVFADIRKMNAVDNDAREYLASKEAGQFIVALAVFTNTPIQNLFANFYLKFSKPPMPTQLFTDKEKAIRWLKLYLQQN